MSAPTQPRSYQDALLAAAALQASGSSSQDGRVLALIALMSQRTISARESAAVQAKRAILRLWSDVDPYDGAAVGEFTIKATAIMARAQNATAGVTAAAQSQQLAAVGIAATVVPTSPVDVRAPEVDISGGTADLVHAAATVSYEQPGDAKAVKVSVTDSTTRAVFNRPARDYRYQMSQGAPANTAADAAVSRINSLVDDNPMLAQRLAEAEFLAKVHDLDDRVIGYRRVIHPELSRGGSCGLCIAASDRMYKIGTLKAIHTNCNCTVAAVTREFDPADELNSVDLGRYYADAQGNTVADLKRTRYQVDEHGELAAVLVPASRYRSRADRAKNRAKQRATTSA